MLPRPEVARYPRDHGSGPWLGPHRWASHTSRSTPLLGLDSLREASDHAGSTRLLAVTVLTSLDAPALEAVGLSGGPRRRSRPARQARVGCRSARVRDLRARVRGPSRRTRAGSISRDAWNTARRFRRPRSETRDDTDGCHQSRRQPPGGGKTHPRRERSRCRPQPTSHVKCSWRFRNDSRARRAASGAGGHARKRERPPHLHGASTCLSRHSRSRGSPRHPHWRTKTERGSTSSPTAFAIKGVVALAEDYEFYQPEEIVANADGPPVLVALDEVTDPQNLGAIIRSAVTLGLAGLIIPKHRAAGITAAVVRASAGATEHASIARVTNLQRTLLALAGLRLGDHRPRRRRRHRRA